MEMQMSLSGKLLVATDTLTERLHGLRFGDPVSHVYNPLEYARASHELYVKRFGESTKRILLMGMNPGPWGMAQTGVPFGEMEAVRDWMGITAPVGKPELEHPKRPIVGFACEKSEVSGRRLWGLFSEAYPAVEDFFVDHYVVNYCPLVWMEESGRNRTPDKLPLAEMAPVYEACDVYVGEHLKLLKPEWVIGVGGFAEARLARIVDSTGMRVNVGRILHPSPASPAANRDWAGTVATQLRALGLWK
ncbi:MAG: single-stranded DNA-binding protein [Verrucomicrobiales bacterium]|jgi:single-strand selective monofunctional uracil DNA glycosylase|nr:single-stranded DNA-binding protein [Verrucomicrobiales bacterium]